MNNNHLIINKRKLNSFKLPSLTFLLILSLVFGMLTGCASKDEEVPTINKVSLEGNVITVDASDNKEVSGYIAVTNLREPSLESEDWQVSNIFTLEEDDKYIIWVKDSSDNLTRYSEEIEINYNLALKFDHLNWLTPAEGTRIVDGVTYDLATLKVEYGDLYRLVEPLTDGQIENRFEYLTRFMEVQREEAIKCNCTTWYIEGGLKNSNDINSVGVRIFNSDMKSMYSFNDSIFNLFKKYYKYNNFVGGYTTSYPILFTSEKGIYGVGTDILDKVSLEDKNFFVRNFSYTYEIFLRAYAELGLEPEYVIKEWDW